MVLQVAKLGSAHSSPLEITAAALGASTDGGRTSVVDRLGASLAFWVMSVTTWVPLSAASRVADTEKCGANGSDAQAVTFSGALVCLTVGSA